MADRWCKANLRSKQSKQSNSHHDTHATSSTLKCDVGRDRARGRSRLNINNRATSRKRDTVPLRVAVGGRVEGARPLKRELRVGRRASLVEVAVPECGDGGVRAVNHWAGSGIGSGYGQGYARAGLWAG